MTIDWLDVKSRIYAPYSNMQDMAFVSTQEGLVFPGVRVENASYPLTVSAVQAAYFSAISEGCTPVAQCHHFPDEATAQFFEKHMHLPFIEPQQIASHPHFELIMMQADTPRSTLTALLDASRPTYSHFRVSALIGNRRDGFVSGVNVELPAWSLGLCAERVAIAKAVSCNFSAFEELHVITEKGSFCSPCGACRQVLYEFNPGMEVFMHHPDGSTSRVFVRDLLPYSFGLH
jgi:homotetrameric cytidine deaminase